MKPFFIHFPLGQKHLPNLNYIMGGHQQCSNAYTYGPAIRRYYIIEYVNSGKGEYTVAGHVYKVHAGQAFIIKPYETHILRADKNTPWEYTWIGFSTDLELPKIIKNNYVFDAEAISDIFLRLTDGNHKKRTDTDYITEIYGIFARLYDLESLEDTDGGGMIDQALAIIRDEYASITVQSLADRFFVNRSYFGAQFKKRTGKSPKAYIDETRLNAATMMMREFGYTVTQAALATGYSDVMSFSRMYKKHFGKSPRNLSLKEQTILLK